MIPIYTIIWFKILGMYTYSWLSPGSLVFQDYTHQEPGYEASDLCDLSRKASRSGPFTSSVSRHFSLLHITMQTLIFSCFYNYVVSAKFVFGTDVRVVAECPEEYKEFVEEVSAFIGLFDRLPRELPLYKFYENKLFQDFKRSVMVSALTQ